MSRLVTINLCLQYPGFHGFLQSALCSVLDLGESTVFPESQRQYLRLGGTSEYNLVQVPPRRARPPGARWSQSCSVEFWVPWDRDPTVSLNNLFEYSINLTVWTVSLNCITSIPIYAKFSCYFSLYHWRGSVSIFFTSLSSIYKNWWFPLNLLYPRLNMHSQFPWYVWNSSPWIIWLFVGLSLSMLLILGSYHWIQCSKCKGTGLCLDIMLLFAFHHPSCISPPSSSVTFQHTSQTRHYPILYQFVYESVTG